MTEQAKQTQRGLEKNAPKREIFGWAMYDIANQAYTTIVISFVYSAFFVAYIVPQDSAWRDAYWSIAIIGSTLMAMVLSPIVGQWIDQGVSKKKLLGWSTAICASFTCLLYWVNPGDIWWGIAIILVTNTAWMLGEAIMSAFLPELATRKNMGFVSGLGWGLGYLGGFVSMVMVSVIIIRADPDTQTEAYISQHQWAMVAISIYFVLVAIPTFLLLKNRPRRLKPVAREPWYVSLNFIKQRNTQPMLFKFFWAFLFYMAGVQTVIKFIGIYTTGELGMTQQDLVAVFLATQFSALFGAIGFGILERFVGARKVLFAVIGIWLLAIFGMYTIHDLAAWSGWGTRDIFLIIALLAGCGIGSIQASSRSLVGLLASPERDGSAFGLWGVFNRLAMLLAATFGVAADLFSRQDALLLVIGFFVIGALLLARVRDLSKASRS
ncbi:MFS transporter [Aliidiomarina halalkaliphila]|uniref:MFS transporter n=1 Tax=Aliidiomarina halalkaliphila TaxID=2593535 RepID=A0A552WZ87_9GAMM|nr:MFS transporter [Aliidiomarina halalkaliphila]TRW48054.1 MFS transporter [Aliidiomarina halalkaliphila]